MRKLWIFVGALLVLVVAAVVAAAVALNRFVAANHDRLIADAQTALGRQVSVGRIRVSVWGGLGVRLDDVRIAEDPRFDSDSFAHIVTLRVRAKLWPLLQQRFTVGRIVATQPHITLIRNADGEWNYTTLRPLTPTHTSTLAPGIMRAAYTPAAAPAAAPASAAPFMLPDIAIADGTLVVIDQTQTPARTTEVEHVDAALRSTGPAAPVEIRVAAALAAETRNVDVYGHVGPWSSADGLPVQLSGTLGPLLPFDARIEALHVVAVLTPAQVRVTELTGHLLGGVFTLSGEYPLHAEAGIAVRGTVRDLDLAEVFTATTGNRRARIGGKAHLIIDVSGTGTTREAIEASLTGRVVADIHRGMIKDLNLANTLLGTISRMPVIGATVSEKIKPKYPRVFADPDTHFETLHGIFTIGEQHAQTDDLAMVTPDYGIHGRGSIGFNQHVSLASTLRMSKRFSDDVVADLHAAKYLLDDDAQLAVPFHLHGDVANLRVNIGKDDMMTLVQRGAARGGAKDLLDKLFGAPPQDARGEQKDPVTEGLRRLFGR